MTKKVKVFIYLICCSECLLLPHTGEGEPPFLGGRQLQGQSGHLVTACLRLKLQQSPASFLQLSRLQVDLVNTLLACGDDDDDIMSA